MTGRPTEKKADETVQKKSIADLFNGLPYRHFPPKHMILYQGDKAERVYYIISGYARMYNITSKGNERTMAIIGPGESLPLVQAEVTRYFYDALSDVEAAYGTYEEIIDRFLADKDYMEVARKAGVRLMQRMVEQMEVLSYDNAVDKVERALKFLAEYYGEEESGYRRIKFRITHQEMANLVNLTRETVTHIVNKLEDKQFIQIGEGGHILVMDPEAVNEDKKAVAGKASLSNLGRTLKGYRRINNRAV